MEMQYTAAARYLAPAAVNLAEKINLHAPGSGKVSSIHIGQQGLEMRLYFFNDSQAAFAHYIT